MKLTKVCIIRWIDRKCIIYTQWNTSQPWKWMKSCHFQQNAWKWKRSRKVTLTQKRPMSHVLSHIWKLKHKKLNPDQSLLEAKSGNWSLDNVYQINLRSQQSIPNVIQHSGEITGPDNLIYIVWTNRRKKLQASKHKLISKGKCALYTCIEISLYSPQMYTIIVNFLNKLMKLLRNQRDHWVNNIRARIKRLTLLWY